MTWEIATLELTWNEEEGKWWAEASFSERKKGFFVDHPKDDEAGATAKAREYLKTKGDVVPVMQAAEEPSNDEGKETPEA